MNFSRIVIVVAGVVMALIGCSGSQENRRSTETADSTLGNQLQLKGEKRMATCGELIARYSKKRTRSTLVCSNLPFQAVKLT